MRVKAFQGLRPDPSCVDQVASLPYDVVSTEEARQLAAGNPASFLHVVRAEIDLPEGADPYAEATYEKARENFQRLQDEGKLVREEQPALYLYQQEMNGHVQTGITAVCHVQDYENDVVKKHEKTRPAKENDRLKLNMTLRAHPGPVFLTYQDDETINQICQDTQKQEPLFNFVAPDNVRHTVWKITETTALEQAFARIPAAYVADGHHRSASAARLGKELASQNPNHTGEEDYNWFLSVIFPASELNILAYNRVVRDLNGMSPLEFMNKVRELGTVYENNAPAPEKPGQISIYLEGRWFGLVAPESGTDDPIARLDVSYLQDKILSPLLGIDDPRTDERIDFIGGIRGTEELEKRVNNGEFAVAFSMYPTTVDQLMAIADAGAIMPPKSTWFEPKLRSGLFVHTV